MHDPTKSVFVALARFDGFLSHDGVDRSHFSFA
jgi:hypothetical protein